MTYKCCICKGYYKELIKVYIWANKKNNLENHCYECFYWTKNILNPYDLNYDIPL